MAKSSSPAPRNDSSAQSFPASRPRYLRASHAYNIREGQNAATAPAQDRESENTDADSCNIAAAEWLAQEREELGLTIEEAANVANVSATTIWRRENALVDLGPLKQLVRLKKERASRRMK